MFEKWCTSRHRKRLERRIFFEFGTLAVLCTLQNTEMA